MVAARLVSGSGGAEDEGHGGARRERIGDVDLRADDGGEGVVLDVADDADDDGPVALKLVEAFGGVGEVEFLADGIGVGPELVGENVVNDSNVLMIGIVRFGEVAALDEGCADGREEAGQDAAMVGHDGVLLFGRCAFFPVVVVPVAGVVEREMRDGGDGLDSGERGEIVLELVERGVTGHGDAEGDDVLGVEAGIEAEDVDEGAGEEAGSEEEHEGEGDFRGDEDAGEVTATPPGLAA
jgi:hypothetical protein